MLAVYLSACFSRQYVSIEGSQRFSEKNYRYNTDRKHIVIHRRETHFPLSFR
jgi:hypothetical protein